MLLEVRYIYLLGHYTMRTLSTRSTYLQQRVLSYESKGSRQIFIPNYGLKSHRTQTKKPWHIKLTTCGNVSIICSVSFRPTVLKGSGWRERPCSCLRFTLVTLLPAHLSKNSRRSLRAASLKMFKLTLPYDRWAAISVSLTGDTTNQVTAAAELSHVTEEAATSR